MAYELIAANVLSSAGSMTVSSIPQTYTDLFVIMSVRSNRNGQYQGGVYFRLNNLTTGYITSGYDNSGYGTYNTTGNVPELQCTGGAGGTFTWATYSFYISNYANTSHNKSYTYQGYGPDGGAGYYRTYAYGAYNTTTSAVTSLVATESSGSLVAGSFMYVYGIK